MFSQEKEHRSCGICPKLICLHLLILIRTYFKEDLRWLRWPHTSQRSHCSEPSFGYMQGIHLLEVGLVLQSREKFHNGSSPGIPYSSDTQVSPGQERREPQIPHPLMIYSLAASVLLLKRLLLGEAFPISNCCCSQPPDSSYPDSALMFLPLSNVLYILLIYFAQCFFLLEW